MADLGECWPKEPDWSAAPHAWGLEIRRVSDVFQTLVSGNLEVWSAGSRIGLDVAPAPGRDYAVRVARDRVLAVTAQSMASRLRYFLGQRPFPGSTHRPARRSGSLGWTRLPTPWRRALCASIWTAACRAISGRG